MIINILILLAVLYLIYLIYSIRLFPTSLEEIIIKFFDLSNKFQDKHNIGLERLKNALEKQREQSVILYEIPKYLDALNKISIEADKNNSKFQEIINTYTKTGRETNSVLKSKIAELDNSHKKHIIELNKIKNELRQELRNGST